MKILGALAGDVSIETHDIYIDARGRKKNAEKPSKKFLRCVLPDRSTCRSAFAIVV